MKKLFVNFMLVAVAAMAFTACQNEIDGGVVKNEENTVTMNFVADAPESRTSVEIDGTTATFSWAEEGETFTFVQNTTDGLEKGTNVSFTNNAGLAEISATFTEATSPIVAVYPAKAWVDSKNDDFNKAKIIVPTDQTITDGTFDPNADLLVSKVVTPENANDTHMLQFARLVAVAKMTIKNLPVVGNETIEKVNFSIDGENALTGRLYIDLATAEVSEWGYYGQNFNNVNLTGNVAATTANDIYFTCMPTTIASGDTFTLEVKTDVAVYTRTVTIPEDSAIEFNSGRVTTFGVNMASAERITISGIALPWSESFDSEDLSMYEIVSGGSATKVYPDDNLANGTTKGEILIGKNGGSMTANIASDGKAKTLNLWFKSNIPGIITVSSDTEGVTITKLTDVGYTITLEEGVSTFKLKLANESSDKNTRVDDIVLTEEAPSVTSIETSGMTVSFTAGDSFVFDGIVKAIYTNGVSEDVTAQADVDNSEVNMSLAGTYPVTVTYNDLSTVYEITVQAAGVQTETVELGTGTFANDTITWTQGGVTVVQAKGNASQNVSSSYTAANKMRLYQGQTLTFSCDTNITKIELVTSGKYYGKTAYVDVGTLTNPKVDGCTITWTGSANKIVLTNGTGSGGEQIRTSSIKITYEVTGEAGGETTEPATQTLSFPNDTYTATVGEPFTAPTLSGAQTTVTYSSSDTKVATVNATTGAVTLVGAGTTTITASAAATDAYKAAEASYTLNVNAAQDGGETGDVEKTAVFNWSGYATDTTVITVEDITFTGSKGTHSNTSARIYNGTLRTYAGNTVTFKAADGYVITSITGISAFAFTGSQQTVEFTGLSKATYSTSVTVTYKAAN